MSAGINMAAQPAVVVLANELEKRHEGIDQKSLPTFALPSVDCYDSAFV